jgi:hypothetical protein
MRTREVLTRYIGDCKAAQILDPTRAHHYAALVAKYTAQVSNIDTPKPKVTKKNGKNLL